MGSKLRDFRRARGLSQQGLARLARCSTASLVYIERYGHVPGGDLRHRLAQVLDVDVGDIWPEVAGACGGLVDSP